MAFLKTFTCVFVSFLVLALSTPSHSTLCPPDSPLLPRPTTLHSSPLFTKTSSSLTSTLNSAISGDLTIPWALPNVSFSIAVVSLSDPSPYSPLWEYHHLATNNINGTKHVDGDSQYLIGSISKVFTDLLLLKSGLNMDDPVTKYLPELEGESVIQWEDVTLGALGDHLSGMPGTYGFPEISFLFPVFEDLGFPHLPVADFPNCGVIGLNAGCTKQQLLANLKTSHPIAAPNLRPSYSSLAFTLISYALESATGKNYSQLLHDEILSPLNMTNTGISPGSDEKAVIPSTDSSWGSDYGDNAPGGGLYSSTNDLSSLLASIISLSGSPILSRAQALSWLKPQATTSKLNTLVGRQWEIFRTQNLTRKYPHTIDLFTKGGTAVGYQSIIAVIEQYGLGIVVLTAGAQGAEAQEPLFEYVVREVVEIVEEVARAEAGAYVGKYQSSDAARGEMEIGIDDGPGLVLKKLSRNGTDMLESIRTLFNEIGIDGVRVGNLSNSQLRIYPTDVWREVGGIREEDWRVQFDIEDTGWKSGLKGWSEKEHMCTAWITGGALYYGGESVDRFVFSRETKGGNVVGAKVPSLRLNLTMSG